MKWYLAVLKQYATFSGRAGRSEYWFFADYFLVQPSTPGDNEYGAEPGSDPA